MPPSQITIPTRIDVHIKWGIVIASIIRREGFVVKREVPVAHIFWGWAFVVDPGSLLRLLRFERLFGSIFPLPDDSD
jgi:hypothetical protein